MSFPSPYRIFNIPTPPSDDHVASYTDIRLAALSTNPEAFGSTYERESKFTTEMWTERLNTNGRTTFAAEIKGAENSTSSWIGTLSVLSPCMLINIPQDPPYPPEIAEGEKKGEIDVYLLVGMWVHPEHRGKGVGKMLVERALNFVFTSHAESESDKKRVILLEVHHANTIAKTLYLKSGFQETKKGGQSGVTHLEEEEGWMIWSND